MLEVLGRAILSEALRCAYSTRPTESIPLCGVRYAKMNDRVKNVGRLI